MPVYHKNDPRTIQHMFNAIARRYDKANSVLSFCLHKKWNRQLVRHVFIPNQSHVFLDLCCGTGDIAYRYLNDTQAPCQAYLLDFSSNMLACAQNKIDQQSLQRHQIEYIEADAQAIPLSSASVDRVTLAYGIRNVKDPTQCLKEIHRVLKQQGCVGILELTQPQSRFLQWGHQLYLRTILPILGRWVTDNQEAYEYLQSSIQAFIPPQELEQIMQNVGFTQTKRLRLAGGIATILIGYKS